ncbi:MAG: hypothetical protein CMN87_03275 [Stappia sp.]|uniref:DUF2000 family protein n=1 Tax=Stappia sp. TaxID=1870903 RepID=UPI000C45B19D|nr:DUF2000 family protein [Stappia sp.]MAA98954.1 hypothetical protein [Stappia sp.]MBM19013.1 hypothetical protein [Stappia sp.]
MFDTKIAIIVRDDLEVWRKLNVTAFLATGIAGAGEAVMGEPYRDGDGNPYTPLAGQPIIILSADAMTLKKIHERGLRRNAHLSLYIDEMFTTGHDAANRAAVERCRVEDLSIAGLALREDRKLVDKITKGASMHP